MILHAIKNVLIRILTLLVFSVFQIIKTFYYILTYLINIVGIFIKIFLFITFTLIKATGNLIIKGIPYLVIFTFQLSFDIFTFLIFFILTTLKYIIKLQQIIFKIVNSFYNKLVWQRFIVLNFKTNRLFRLVIFNYLIKSFHKYKSYTLTKITILNNKIIKFPLIYFMNYITNLTIKSEKNTLKIFNTFFTFIKIYIKFMVNSLLLGGFILKSLYCFLINFLKPSTYIKIFKTIYLILILITKEVYYDIKYNFQLLLKLPFFIKNIIISLRSLLKNTLSFLRLWSTKHYFKTLLLFLLLIIVGINLNLFFNHRSTFLKSVYHNENHINIANTIPTLTSLLKNLKDNSLIKYYKISLNVKNYKELNNELIKNNITQTEAEQIFKALNNVTKNTKLSFKGDIQATLTTSKQKQGEIKVAQLEIPLNNTLDLIVAPTQNNLDFSVYTKKKKITKYLIKQKFIIEDNYYDSAKKANIPSSILSILSNIFSWHIDFQREINPGNSVEILYQCLYNDNQLINCNNLIYASIKLKHKTLSFYNFGGKFYLSNGRSAATSLLRTPIEGYKVSSPFGKRSHPILGYSIFHKGVDFAAPTGTPVPAAGNGIIKKAIMSPSYGKYVELQHNAYLSTVYAHLNAFAKDLKEGKKVSQREIIGYVGATGLATGPHLHYEIHFNGRPVNPMDIKIPSLVYLSDENLAKFNKFKEEIEHILFKLPLDQKTAIDYKNT